MDCHHCGFLVSNLNWKFAIIFSLFQFLKLFLFSEGYSLLTPMASPKTFDFFPQTLTAVWLKTSGLTKKIETMMIFIHLYSSSTHL